VLYPVPFGRALYDTGIRRSKGAFGALLGESYGFSHFCLSSPPLHDLVWWFF
jgi:hypothetical protein